MTQYLKTSKKIYNILIQLENLYNDPNVIKKSIAAARLMNIRYCSDPPAIIAALLHNIGELLPNNNQDSLELAKKYLKSTGFPSSVYEPISLYNQSKRYLITKYPNYENQLQDKVMSDQECIQFENNQWFDPSILLRIVTDKSQKLHIHNGYSILEYQNQLKQVLLDHITIQGWKYKIT